mgnify:FL=1
MNRFYIFIFTFLSLFLFNCKKETFANEIELQKNNIKYAKSLSIEQGTDFTLVKISNPWPNAKETFTYVLRKNNSKIPSTYSKLPIIDVPLKTSIVTSTSIIPFLEQLGVEEKLIGFPHTDYISSEKEP